MVVAINLMGGVSRSVCNFVLDCLARIIRITLESVHTGIERSLSPFETKLMQDFPKDVRRTRAIFDLEARTTTFASCPKCSSLYAPTISPSTKTEIYPTSCSAPVFPSSHGKRCNEVLVEFRTSGAYSIDKPVRPFTFRHLEDFISRLLSRPDIEEQLELRIRGEGVMTDICDGPLFKDLLRCIPSYNQRCQSPDRTLYLFWELCVDWLNPYGTKIAGIKNSVGMMSLICYNLPPDIRYRVENMHLCGVIPGPQETSKEQINHYLRPLVDDFLRLWDPGVFFSRTARFHTGRSVICILAPLISDIPAAKKISGSASHKARMFCTLC